MYLSAVKPYDLIIIGGGAAGFFAALNVAKLSPKASVLLLEKSPNLLGKVKISGGGRCNVTNACFIPAELAKNYPRGRKELLGPFHQFQPADTFAWFEERGVQLKTEGDNRVFPESNSSQTIIDCFLNEAKKYKVNIKVQTGVETIVQQEDSSWIVSCNQENYLTKKLLIASGSTPQVIKLLEKLDLPIISSVPSLFTFNIKHPILDGLSGISIPQVELDIPALKLAESGPLLITHWGLSGPAILRLSAWGARLLNQVNYRFTLRVNFTPNYSEQQVIETLKATRDGNGKKIVLSNPLFDIPNRLWQSISIYSGIKEKMTWAELNNKLIVQLGENISKCHLEVTGKSTFKDEFVTAGGVSLKAVNFKTMQSNAHANLYFAGEVLDIDAITGGFNFQAAWTTAYIAAKHISAELQIASM